jgi:hypothetical protein
MFRAKWGTSEANQALATAYHSNRTTPMVRCKGWRQRTPIPRRRSLRWARRTGRYVVVRLSPIIFCPRRQCAAVDGETSRSGCRGKGQRIGFCVLAHRRTFLADVWSRRGGWREIAVLGADQPHRHRQAQRTAIVIGERHQTVPRMEAAGWQLLARCRSLCRRLLFPLVGEHRKLALRLDSTQMTRTSPNQRGA